MTTLTPYADTARFDQFFAAVIGFCVDFFGGTRQGRIPSVPTTRPGGPAPLSFIH